MGVSAAVAAEAAAVAVGSSSAPVLTSLPLLDELRTSLDTAGNWTRQPGSNLDVLLADPSINPDVPLAICRLYTLLPFTQGDDIADQDRYEEAVTVALAAQQLNVGDGSILPELDGLNKRCNVRFTVEYADTEDTASVALEHVISATSREPGMGLLPCAFVGALKSSISIPTSIVTGLRNYPQVSGSSTSTDLNDKTQYPLFARTIPSDQGNAVPIIEFLHNVLGINHLAVINVNDAYGSAYVEGLRLAAQAHAPDMRIHQAPVNDDLTSIRAAVASVKATQYRYIFAIIYTQQTTDTVLSEAYKAGIAGDGNHEWLFSDSFSKVTGRKFESGSPLDLAYRGVGMIEAAGGVPNIGLVRYKKFRQILATVNNPTDLDYLFSKFPQYEDPKFQESLANFTNFLSPVNGAQAPFVYEAAIALGLAACAVSPGINETEGFFLNGKTHYERMVHTAFQGVSGDVVLNPETGSKEPNHTLYKVTNFVDAPISGDNKIVQYEEVLTNIYEKGQWKQLNPFVFNDGSTNTLSDIPLVALIDDVVMPPIRISVLLLCGLIFLLVGVCIAWTHKNRNTRVVLASQPFFLHIICVGVLLMGLTIVPLSIDHGIATLKECSIACTTVPWLAAMGFSMTVSALFTKTHRINIILQHANRMQRIKVTIWDVAKPMIFLLGMNTIILTVMSALAPPGYEIITVNRDAFGRPDEIRGQCRYREAYPYIGSVFLMNIGALLFAIVQGIKARHLSTEFAESAQIFRALIAIMMVLFVGGPVMVLARQNANTFVFVASAIAFVATTSILLLLFIPKVKFLRKSKMKRSSNRIRISGIEASESLRRDPLGITNYSSRFDAEEVTGIRILTTKTPAELLQEVDELKRLLREAKAECNVDLGETQDAAQGVSARPRRIGSILKKKTPDSDISSSARSEDSAAKDIEEVQDYFQLGRIGAGDSLARHSRVTLESVHEETSPSGRSIIDDDSSALDNRKVAWNPYRKKREAAKTKFETLRTESSTEREQCLETSEEDSSDVA